MRDTAYAERCRIANEVWRDWLAVHRFYMGKWGTGLLWFFTLGFFFVGQIIDLFLLGGAVDRHNERVHHLRPWRVMAA